MIRLARAPLVRALEALAPIVGSYSAEKPSRFAGVLLEAGGNLAPHLTAISPDYSLVGLRALDIEARGSTEPVSALVPHKKLLEAVKSLPGSHVEIEARGGQATLRSEGQRSRSVMRIPVIADDLVLPEPLKGEAALCSLTGKELAEALGEVAYALPRDATRPSLSAVLLETAGPGPASGLYDMAAVATSGRQIGVHRIDGVGENDFRISTPPPAVPVLRGFFQPSERVSLLHAAGETAYATFRGEWGTLRVRLPGEEYPNVAPLIAQPVSASLTADRVELLAAATRAVIACGDEGGVTFGFNPNQGLALYADAFREEMEAEGEQEIAFRYTARRLKAALEKVKGERVTLERRGSAMIYLRGAGCGLHGFSRIND